MIKYMTMIPLRLFYPEPGDTGGGETNGNGGETETTAGETDTTTTTENGETDNETEDSFFDDVGDDGTHEEKGNEDNSEGEPELLTFDKSLNLQETEVRIISELAQKHGVKGEVMVPLFTELSSRLNENMQAEAKAEDASRRKALRDAWGKDYKSNVKGTADFIRAVGKARGWSEDEIKAMDTPEAFKVMNDIRLFLGTNKSFGTNGGAMNTEEPVTPQNARERMKELVSKYMEMRYQYEQHKPDITAQMVNGISDEHQKMGRIVHGKDFPRLLKEVK